jgi:hypothetical protein
LKALPDIAGARRFFVWLDHGMCSCVIAQTLHEAHHVQGVARLGSTQLVLTRTLSHHS